MRDLLAPSSGKGSVDKTAGVCPFRVIDKGKAKRDFHPHVPLVIWIGIWKFVWVVLAWKGQQKIESHRFRWSGFLKDRWLVARSEKCEGTCTVGPLASL